MTNFQKPGHHSPNEFPYGATAPYPAPAPTPQHGEQLNGYVFDANLGRWLLVNRNETVAGKQGKISTRNIIIGAIATAAVILGAIGISNLVAEDAPSTSAPASVASAPMSKDDRYIAAMEDIGIEPTVSEQALIEAALGVCDSLDYGYSREYNISEAYSANVRSGGGLTRSDMTRAIDLSIDTYCPEYS